MMKMMKSTHGVAAAAQRGQNQRPGVLAMTVAALTFPTSSARRKKRNIFISHARHEHAGWSPVRQPEPLAARTGAICTYAETGHRCRGVDEKSEGRS